MVKSGKAYHTGMVKKSITINAPKNKVWRKISNIVGLPSWLVDVKKTEYLSKKKRGVGAIRKLTFNDGNTIEEHVVAWKDGEYFTYIATEGLPLRAYVATLSIKPKSKNSVTLTWESYVNSQKMTEKEFLEFLVFMGTFYETSLCNLKSRLEK
ncbi:MAG: SRPBCC family protein [Nitrosopumilaceae archaeon]|nr:SRPBCC family protein [Nitrosopumilaceae archaeon]NIP09932.1 SRPBCC family protein [Nitrosopumilaceae archaeon]NIS94703.1 SRPBCC family protein [Nitrosopumilaceae archaeon]